MKRIVVYSLLLIYLISTTLFVVNAEGIPAEMESASNETKALGLKLGDYILLGNYNDAPILWRYVADDNNGMLMLSDKVLCVKTFGSTTFWSESVLRKWLNSNVPEGEEEWENLFKENPNFNFRAYDREKGFLHEDNFSSGERNLMKPVVQWTMLPQEHLDLSENGKTEAYSATKTYIYSNPPESITYTIPELSEGFIGAAQQLEDIVFLFDEIQIYNIWNNFGTVKTTGTPMVWIKPPSSYDAGYRLRTPSGNHICNISSQGDYGFGGGSSIGGIRPAFYLDTDNATILSGNGTSDDPYVIDGKKKDGIAVFCNGSELQFDQYPVMENDRVLVPMRRIFEELGAEVSWDGDTQTVTAAKDRVMITMQIDNPIMTKNTESIELDVPPRLVGDRTMVPIRAVAEGLGATVEWVEEQNMVKITTVE